MERISDRVDTGTIADASKEVRDKVFCIEAEIILAGTTVVVVIVVIAPTNAPVIPVATIGTAVVVATAVVNVVVVVEGGFGVGTFVGTCVGFGVGECVGEWVVSVAPINTLMRALAAPPLFSAKIW